MIPLLLLWLGCSGCSPGPAEVEPSPAPAARKGTNVVLIVIDSVRADHLSLYGYERPTSPNLDAWAADAIVFESAYTHATWTRPAVASLLSSVLPSAHGLQTRDAEPHRSPPPLQQTLKVAGYQTQGVVSSPLLGPKNNPFMRGFHALDMSMVGKEPGRAVTSAEVTDKALAAWAARGEDPFFLYVHYNDPHALYAATHGEPDFGDTQADRYDSELAFVDRHLGRLLDALGDQAVVAITSDHGESLGEHGITRHGNSLYEEQLHVPLIVKAPGLKGERIKKPVPLLDLTPSLLKLVGIKPPPYYAGRPWRIDRFGVLEVGKRNIVFETRLDAQLRGAIKGRYKLIEDRSTGARELYDLKEDPAEATNRIDDPERAREVAELTALLP